MNKTVSADEHESWPAVLTYWRSLPAEMFDHRLQDEVSSCVRSVMTTMGDLRSALEGDVATACSLALKTTIPARIGPHVDLVMTALLNCAFVNPAAALVLSSRLEQMPLPWRSRTRLSTSWKVYNIYLARRSYGRRSIPVALLRRDDER
ncbi:hypothetical protein QA649_37065 [Bradyrhizobium sp. CB1717]|uniref:hypothetical protein n=1 Tax=Bradyrhizobium sp. CB1717 TaxID=3039154 RepID=UPI0024B1D12A|nr:hypothetical protein [Bradyrhizobium sp. CB1717]WFU23573.1 hypothetical protein QA649_37065 [Bradyrhizobium sp. CB1717]